MAAVLHGKMENREQHQRQVLHERYLVEFDDIVDVTGILYLVLMTSFSVLYMADEKQ